jgi:hypothetical protein
MRLHVANVTLWMTALMLLQGMVAVPAQQSEALTSERAATSSNSASLPQVTVEGHLLEKKTWRFAINVTAASGFFLDEAVQQWRRPICPFVAGLPPSDGQFVFDHLVSVFDSVGVPRGKAGCHPNFFFVVTDEPETLLKGAWKRNWHLFGDVSPTLVERFIHTRRPVRVWYNNILAGADGPAVAAATVPALSSDPMFAASPFAETPAVTSDGNQLRARFTVTNELLSVIAIIDPTQVQGLTWVQVTDYVAMSGLTRTAPDVDVGDTPSILNLFSAAAGPRPEELSGWDRDFLKDLYLADPGRRGQRLQVSHQMARDLQTQSTIDSQ